MKTTIYITIFCLLGALLFWKSQSLPENEVHQKIYAQTENIQPIVEEEEITEAQKLWKTSEYKNNLSFSVFERAYNVFKNQQDFNSDIITIVDFSKPSSEKRLFIINLKTNALLYYTYVAHGKFSGENETVNYSNVPQSKMSSLGFYKTAETYMGKHGYSLRLDGLEQGINHKARARAIVLHGANYVNENFIKTHGRLGRSWGCPAVPQELSEEIINTIKDGSCLYIHDDNQEYLSQTKM